VKSPEFRRMIGDRKKDSDGFTYVYGCVKMGGSVRPATARCKARRRNDKRSIKAQEIRFERNNEC
jgi:hypothetical protein